MEIKLMTQIKENPKLEGVVNRGMPLSEIEELETRYNGGNPFPKALREYLYLAGDFNNFGFDDIEGVDYLQKTLKNELDYTNHELERPFFAVHVLDSQYSGVFLDEQTENPAVYRVSPFLAKGNLSPLIVKTNFDFAGLVDTRIAYARTGKRI